ncbi:hypothetical protein [Mycolicibacter kumamotonensis]|uniref:hypothetical protein n=1 Tax=Mycolicibacter kumamotonensis TaxID=354243 RepID=UPI00080665F6|nr:hypothetical protein [Mycolicibacter kumamotonensis]
MDGQRICGTHGGRAPQNKRAARRRLDEAADKMAKELLRMASDANVADSVKLAAIRDALDRAGISARTAVDVEVTAKPYESILEGLNLSGGSREEYRRSVRGESDSDSRITPALPRANTGDPIDAEIVDESDQRPDPYPLAGDDDGEIGWPEADSVRVAPADFDPLNPIADEDSPFGPPPTPDQLMTFEEAVMRAAEMKRRAASDARARGHATIHRNNQRALPRGRSG